jgi:hypothetical protein
MNNEYKMRLLIWFQYVLQFLHFKRLSQRVEICKQLIFLIQLIVYENLHILTFQMPKGLTPCFATI